MNNVTEIYMEELRILKRPEVTIKTGLQQSTIYKLMASGDFPKQIKLTSKSVGWSSKDINSWIESKVSRLSNHDEVK